MGRTLRRVQRQSRRISARGSALRANVVAVSANILPTAAISFPLDNAVLVVGTTYTLTGTWADPDGTVVSGRFLLNGADIGAVTVAPGTVSLSFTPAIGDVAAGVGLVLEVTNNKGSVGVSPAVPISVAI